MAITFRVASSSIIKTAADRRLASTDAVLTLLKWIERHLAKRKPSESSLAYSRRNSSQLGSIQMEISMRHSSIDVRRERQDSA